VQPTKLSFTLSRLECGLQFHAVGLLGPFSSKTSLSRSVTLTWSMNSLDTLLERKLQSMVPARQAQYVKQYGRLCASFPRCSLIKSFRKHYIPQVRQICHHHILSYRATLKATPTAITQTICMNWMPTYTTSLSAFHPWRCRQCLRMCFAVLVHTSELYVTVIL
jgi:hypothetical protein